MRTLRGCAFLLALVAVSWEGQPRPKAVPPPIPCAVFPADNVWNTPVDTLPIDANSSAYINSIGTSGPLFPDFGSGLYQGAPIGIPYTIVTGIQTKVPIQFEYADESDPGPYPIPPDALIEGGQNSTGDRHILLVDRDNCRLYEIYAAYPQSGGSWRAGSGAVFDLKSNALRPDSWTSADAGGLPLLAGLVRYDEVAAGEIRHAIRFTAQVTQKKYIWPARHHASSNTSASVPPMGLRVRLKASYDISSFSPQNQVILRALKRYGMILADNGSNWFMSGAPDDRWNNDDTRLLRRVLGSNFEAVDTSAMIINANSGQARQPVRSPAGVVHAASYQSAPAAPGQMITVFGTGLGPAVGVGARLNSAGLVDNNVGETQALFDGQAAPLIYVQDKQTSAVVPYAVAGKATTQLVIAYRGVSAPALTIPVAESAPGLFTFDASGKGQGAILNQDTSLNGPANPAAKGSVVVLYASGEGATSPAGADGRIAGSAPLPKPVLAVVVTIGGVPATVQYAGAAPGQVAGLLQVNAVVPLDGPSGNAVPVVLSVGGAASQAGVTLAVR